MKSNTMEKFYGSGNNIKLSWWQIKKMKKKMKKSYIIGDSIKKIAEYIKKWEEKKAERLLNNNLEKF